MTYEEFETIVNEIVEKLYLEYDYDRDAFRVKDGAIIQTHETGGARGGNCLKD